MPIIDEELFVRCRSCGWEAATGIRRTEEGLTADPPGERRITCHRCGTEATYGDADWFHRTVEQDREKVDV
jgi:RNase P subunit RPR2